MNATLLSLDPQLADLARRLRDGGPVYTETILGRPVVEPWNAASAVLFIVIVAYWLIRLRGRYARYPFLSCSLPLLLAGGIGGTLYHATRSSRVFFLMDVGPIIILCLATAVFLWSRLLPRWWYALILILPFILAQRLSRYFPGQDAINFSYALQAAAILLPTVLFLIKTRFRHGWWVVGSLMLFGIALFFRAADSRYRLELQDYLPMGTHWLWHFFGALACSGVAEFLYRVEGDNPRVACTLTRDAQGSTVGTEQPHG